MRHHVARPSARSPRSPGGGPTAAHDQLVALGCDPIVLEGLVDALTVFGTGSNRHHPDPPTDRRELSRLVRDCGCLATRLERLGRRVLVWTLLQADPELLRAPDILRRYGRLLRGARRWLDPRRHRLQSIQRARLTAYRDLVEERFVTWLAQQDAAGVTFSPEQLQWLELIRDQVAASMGIEMDDFEYAPFAQKGGAGS
jgi:hypothetical protein